MLIDAIITVLASVMNGLVSLLPQSTGLPYQMQQAIDYFGPIWAGWTSIIPALDTMLTIVLLGITIEAAIFTYGGINWTINKLRGSG